MLRSNHDVRRMIKSVYNTLERLNKHPLLYLNFWQQLVEQRQVIYNRYGTTEERQVHL